MDLSFRNACDKSISIQFIHQVLQKHFNIFIPHNDSVLEIGCKRKNSKFLLDNIINIFTSYLPYLERNNVLGVLLFFLQPNSWKLVAQAYQLPVTDEVLKLFQLFFELISSLDDKVNTYIAKPNEDKEAMEVVQFLRDKLGIFFLESSNIIIRFHMDLTKLNIVLDIPNSENQTTTTTSTTTVAETRPKPVRFVRKYIKKCNAVA